MMTRSNVRGGRTLAFALAGLLLGAAPAVAAVALQSGPSGATQTQRLAEGPGLVGGHGRLWWTADGEAWELSALGAWTRMPGRNLPVPVSEVRLLSDCVLLTIGGDVWHLRDDRWVRADRFPG